MRRHDGVTCWRLAMAFIGALLLTGCDASRPESPVEPAGDELRLDARSEVSLTGTVGTRIDSVPVVRLTTRDGAPAPGREIRFLVSGGGSIEVASQRTDTAGIASPGTWTLGTQARPQSITARADGVRDVIFTAVAAPGPPATMLILAGNNQTGGAGTALPIRLQVAVADQYRNPVVGAAVTFQVVFGQGVIVGASAMTDVSGVASSGWTLGGEGAQYVRASAAGKEVVFEAVTCGDSCRVPDLLFTRGDSLYSLVNGVATRLFSAPESVPADGAWSPNGQQIAFSVHDWSASDAILYLMNADGSDAAFRVAGFTSVSWSPDGNRLAVDAGAAGVYTLRVEEDGTSPVLLAQHGSMPAWSPDGGRIAFVNYEVASHSLRVMNADGSAVAMLVPGGTDLIGKPTWSPDGQRLAFAKCSNVSTGPDAKQRCNVFAVSADGSSLVQLTTVDDAFGPAWSADGTRIAFTSHSDIVWIPADAGFPLPPIPLVSHAALVAWRP